MEYQAGFVAGNNVAKNNLIRLFLVATTALLCVTIYNVANCEFLEEKFLYTFSVWGGILACNVVVKKIHEPLPNRIIEVYKNDTGSSQTEDPCFEKQPPGYDENKPAE